MKLECNAADWTGFTVNDLREHLRVAHEWAPTAKFLEPPSPMITIQRRLPPCVNCGHMPSAHSISTDRQNEQTWGKRNGAYRCQNRCTCDGYRGKR